MRLFTVLVLTAISITSCTKSGGSDGGGGNSGENKPPGERAFTTDCGTVFKGDLKNPVAEDQGILVDVIQVSGANAVAVQVEGEQGPRLVWLVGLKGRISDFQAKKAMTILQGMLGPAILFEPNGPCDVKFTGGGKGTAGSLFRLTDGKSFSEALLQAGVAEADSARVCRSELVALCYDALAEDNRQSVGSTVTDFLWKPASDKDGKLAVLLNPGGATVVVNGETLTFAGGGNGRGTTARSNKSGCAYGKNVQVQAFDRNGRALVFPGESTTYTIADGCQRIEFQ